MYSISNLGRLDFEFHTFVFVNVNFVVLDCLFETFWSSNVNTNTKFIYENILTNTIVRVEQFPLCIDYNILKLRFCVVEIIFCS